MAIALLSSSLLAFAYLSLSASCTCLEILYSLSAIELLISLFCTWYLLILSSSLSFWSCSLSF